ITPGVLPPKPRSTLCSTGSYPCSCTVTMKEPAHAGGASSRAVLSVKVVANCPPVSAFTSTRTLAAGRASPSRDTEPAIVDRVPPFEVNCNCPCACGTLLANASNKNPSATLLNLQTFTNLFALCLCIAYFSSNHGAVAGPVRGLVLVAISLHTIPFEDTQYHSRISMKTAEPLVVCRRYYLLFSEEPFKGAAHRAESAGTAFTGRRS